MSRLPIRMRVTLAFAGAMAILLATLSAFLVLRLESQLDVAVRQGLESRAADIASLAQDRNGEQPDDPTRSLSDEDTSLAQVIDARGDVTDATPPSLRRQLLTPAQVSRARTEAFTTDVQIGAEHTPVRLLATPSQATDADAVVVVGQSLETRNEAVQQLRGQLAVGVPIALIIASLVGYAAAAAALRPVRAMSRRSREIEAVAPDARLPVPAGSDEIAELGETLNAMLDRLAATMQRERAFIADASHELRTPLAVMNAEIDVALETARDVPAYRDALESLATQNARVVRLAQDLLVLARADQHQLPMRPEPLDAGTAAASCVRRFEARATQAAIALTCTAVLDAFISADEVRFDQLLDNLVENALRYADRAVALTVTREGGDIVLRVSDDGPGFPPDFAGRAFDRFAVADESRTGGHAGLGLSIVQAIATAHGWTVGLIPSRSGATVQVRIAALDVPV